MSRMAPALAAVSAAAMLAVAGCGGDAESDEGPASVDVRALVAAGLTALGVEGARLEGGSGRLEGAVLRLRVPRGLLHASAGADDVGLVGLMESFEGVRAELEQFCPPPGLLRCRPALQAWGRVRGGRNPRSVAQRAAGALRRLAARTYGDARLSRRGAATNRIVTANGELLAAVRLQGRIVLMSFGGLSVGPPAPPPWAGQLRLDAGPEALAAARAALGARARSALDGARRLSATSPLPR